MAVKFIIDLPVEEDLVFPSMNYFRNEGEWGPE
jgi:hypothetical protein